MRGHLLFIFFILYLFSCRSKVESGASIDSFQMLIPDTSNNIRAQLEWEKIGHLSKIEKQLGLTDLKQGADSFEIRIWYFFSFSNSKELYVLKLEDTNYVMSYYRFYLKDINFDDENRNRNWNAFTDPIVDSSVSKTVLITNRDIKNITWTEVWNLKSQSELGLPDSIGFTDCDTYTIEAADKNKFRFLSHHCPQAYYNKTKLKEIIDFINYYDKLRVLANKNKIVIPYYFD